jgi:hypothetical protein
MPEKRMLILTADQMEVATHQGDVLMILDFSSAAVFHELEVSVRMLPDEARRIATLLVQTARKAQTERAVSNARL